MLVRVRLRFQSTPLHYAQKCWFAFDREKCRLVGDVAHLIASHFGLEQTTQGIQLFMDDFLIPTNENAGIIQDNDLLEVRRVDTCNGVGSSSSSSESSVELESPTRSKRIKTVELKGPSYLPSTARCSRLSIESATVIQRANDESTTTQTLSTKSNLQHNKTTKELHISEKKTKSGATHLTFTSSSSESSSSDSSSEEETLGKQSTTTPISQPLTKPSTSDTKSTQRPTTTTSAQRGRGKGRNRRRRGRTLPSTLVIGGPNDVHTTVSTVYGSSEHTEQAPNERKAVSGWDVQPEEDSTSVPVKNFSTCPNLEGAPRVGDSIAFKLLELSGSCTPEVSQYKLASVVGYDHTSKKVTVKYQEPSNKETTADNATSRLAQYALEQETTMESLEVELDVDSLISPKLVTN